MNPVVKGLLDFIVQEVIVCKMQIIEFVHKLFIRGKVCVCGGGGGKGVALSDQPFNS